MSHLDCLGRLGIPYDFQCFSDATERDRWTSIGPHILFIADSRPMYLPSLGFRTPREAPADASVSRKLKGVKSDWTTQFWTAFGRIQAWPSGRDPKSVVKIRSFSKGVVKGRWVLVISSWCCPLYETLWDCDFSDEILDQPLEPPYPLLDLSLVLAIERPQHASYCMLIAVGESVQRKAINMITWWFPEEIFLPSSHWTQHVNVVVPPSEKSPLRHVDTLQWRGCPASLQTQAPKRKWSAGPRPYLSCTCWWAPIPSPIVFCHTVNVYVVWIHLISCFQIGMMMFFH